MESKGSWLLKRGAAAFMLLLAAVLISSLLIRSLGSAGIGGRPVIFLPHVQDSLLGALVVVVAALFAAFLFFALYIMISQGSAISRGSRNNQSQHRSLAGQLTVMAIFIGLLLIGLHFYSVPHDVRLNPVAINVTRRTGLTANGSASGLSGTEALLFHDILLIALIPVGIIMLLMVGSFISSILEARRKSSFDEDTHVMSRQIKEEIEQIAGGGDPREAIIRVYSRMAEIIERHGVPDSSALTAREFASRALHILGVRPITVNRLTALFEVARYSSHEISPSMADEALNLLRQMEGELDVV